MSAGTVTAERHASPVEGEALTMRERALWLWEHWRQYRGKALLLIVLTLGNSAVLVMYPWVFKEIIDRVTASVSSGDASSLLHPLGLLAALGFAHFAIYATLQTFRTQLNLRFEFAARLRAFEFALRLGPGFFRKFSSGDLVTRLNADVSDKLAWFMCSGIFRVFEALGLIVFCVVMMLSIDPRLTLYTAGPLPFLVLLFVATASRLHARYAAVQQSISRFNATLENCFSGIRVVKAFAAETTERRAVGAAIDEQRRNELAAVRWQTVIDSLYGNVWQLAIVSVLLVGGEAVIAEQITLGDLFAFNSYVVMLVLPMFDVGQFLVRGKQSAVCVDRLCDIEHAQPEPAERNRPAPTARRPEEVGVGERRDEPGDARAAARARELPPLSIEFHDVSYRFPLAENNALAHVSFVARPGSRVAIVGAIGAGKSTCLTLVPRLMEPSQGTVLAGNEPLPQWPITVLRDAIGYVPQVATLFSGTVYENIHFGRAWVDEADVAQAVDAAELLPDLERWPEGSQTVVGARGVRLSGGQKQRVALARAIAGRPSILLLDDCTASLDAHTEERVWQKLARCLPNCTILLVTHRPATLRDVDHIVVLDRGRIREQGTFTALNRPGTHFHDLYVEWQLADDSLPEEGE